MTRPRCDREWEVEALGDGRLGPKEVASLERHLHACAVCGERRSLRARMRELGAAVGGDGPGELVLRRVRARVLRDAAALEATMGARSRRRRLATAVALVAALAVVLVLLRGRALHQPAGPGALAVSAQAPAAAPSAPAVEPLAGDVIASSGARWSQVRDGHAERVRLDEGTVAAHVRPLGLEEAFLVTLPDGELEVRGTTFEVTVRDGATTRVHVDEGTVELRLRGMPTEVLGPGDSWPRAAPPASASAAPAPDAARAAKPAPVDDGAGEYAVALADLEAGRLDAAAAAFRAFVVAHPRAPQAEDASFLEAVALARAGRTDAAALVAERHLAAFPRSFHRKEAAILVARAASARGDCDEARTVLRPWLAGAPDPEATAALHACAAAP